MPKVLLIFFLLMVAPAFGFAQDRKPLTLDEIVSLIRDGVSAGRVAELIEKHGVGFEVDEGVLSKLRQAGANEAILSAARKVGERYTQEQKRKRELEEVRRRLREEEAKKLEEAGKKELEEAKRREEALRRAEAERKKQQEEARRKEEERKKAEEAARRKAEEERKRIEEARRKEEEQKKKQEEERRQSEEAKRREDEARKNEEARRREQEARKRAEAEKAVTASLGTVARAPAPPCVVGLRLQFRYDDGRTFSRRITRRDGELCVVGRSYYDKDWVLVKQVQQDGQEITSATPANSQIGQKWLSFPLVVGKEWEASYSAIYARGGGVGYFTNYFTVLSYEEVSVPAGTFRAFKIKQHQISSARSWGVRYFWYAPEIGYYVKHKSAREESSSEYYWSNVRDYELATISRPGDK